MPDIVFAAVNARYNHTNLAVRSITEYIRKWWASSYPDVVMPSIEFGEWTINQPLLEILRGIAVLKPHIVMFSVYIWNVEIITRLIPELPKVLPGCIVIAGGPEAGYHAGQMIDSLDSLDAVIAGEGEQTCLELAYLYSQCAKEWNTNVFFDAAGNIPGVYSRIQNKTDTSRMRFGGTRMPVKDLGELAFPYPLITDPDNRIYYYESSRGCPFRCSYCLSSVERNVRFMPLERVYIDLQRFLDARVKLVKFVDRTYNLDDVRYISIWQYILEHHNGYTMFHFEIEAEYLSEKALDFIQRVPPGVMQFEIGVQSTNPETLSAVGRSPEIVKLAEHVRRIPPSIHKHLDLIAGLPFEGLTSFARSFNEVLDMEPDILQLGFLKVLYGTSMEKYAREHEWKWMSSAPYEVLSTPYLPYTDLLFLKDIEVLLDIFYNSGSFDTLAGYIGRNGDWWVFFSSFLIWSRKNGFLEMPHTEDCWFEYADRYFEKESNYRIFHELLRFDFLKNGKKGRFPVWCERNYDKEAHRSALLRYTGFGENITASPRLAYAYSEYDMFGINPLDPEHTEAGRRYQVLFLYPKRGEKNAEQTTVFMF